MNRTIIAALLVSASPAYAANPPPIFTISDTICVEGQPCVFTIAKSAKANSYSRVQLGISAVTAKDPTDYIMPAGISASTGLLLTFANNELKKTIAVQTIGNERVDGARTFTVRIAPVRFAAIGRGIATGTIIDDDVAPPPPVEQPTPPTAGYVPALDLNGGTAIDFGYPASEAMGTAEIPGTAAPDLGAFRFLCGFAWRLKDDPIVYPGQPGKSHWHDGFGNMAVNANTTDESLAKTGNSTCGLPSDPKPSNRSGYWIPSFLDGKGNFIAFDEVGIYYKRWPENDPHCNTQGGYPTKFNVEGVACVPVPNRLKMIFGFNMLNPAATPTGAAQFLCEGDLANHETLTQALDRCRVFQQQGKPTHLLARIEAPSCWDGKFTDTPDHRAHVAYPSYGDWGYQRCPTTHPYVMPTFTLTATYVILPTDDTRLWRYSCDEMAGTEPGGCLHADYWKAWHKGVEAEWLRGCINSDLNCSAGNLGTGFAMRWADQSRYVDAAGNVISYAVNPNRIQPIPQ
jgi:hypothetical protein